MFSAFQSNAFQNNSFQIVRVEEAGGGGGKVSREKKYRVITDRPSYSEASNQMSEMFETLINKEKEKKQIRTQTLSKNKNNLYLLLLLGD